MRIAAAMAGVEVLGHFGEATEVAGIQYDSRRVAPGDLFVAMRGGSTNGNRFIDAALERGAEAIITDSHDTYVAAKDKQRTVPFYWVDNGRHALAAVAGNLLGHPEQALAVSAVTGTNGKTTTAFLLEQMLRSVGRQCVLVGTIETHVGDEVRTSEHTTPEASDLLRIFADGVKAGATEAVMEMSSHALDQERVWGVPVDVAMFTNLTQDHLDYHGTMERYGQAKAKLFYGVGTEPPRVAVINEDDTAGRWLLEMDLVTEVMSYGIEAGEFRATEVSLSAGRTSFLWVTPYGAVQIESPLTGKVNVYNLLAASCAALGRGLTLPEIAAAAQNLRQVPGRFQTVPNNLGITVVVDYAHTDDALRNLIGLARELVSNGRVITLFGCGGDRDKTKRPKMGRAAGAGSDLVVLTSDNPRTEDPETILQEALAGVRETNAEFVVEPDRTTAIAVAIKAARLGDTVLIAGKGHEKVQILADRTISFDDVAVAAEIMKGLE